ncbi:L-asparaginase [Sphaerotilus hippei]|uniref:L-asparaginase n=1 Tax=Sphaerotilus hippei TaxID=744406 RepID=A0A318H969_9BURK|nr:asparaginase [Sphaerotilus hippei]PXW94767.1 L-asparaginase [Sphaerotilus hippei]
MTRISDSSARRVVILGTGGTIAGTSARAGDNVGYVAAQLQVDDLVAAIPGLASLSRRGVDLQVEQVAQVDSKDMSHAVWRRLTAAAERHLKDPQVCGVVVTHGTDTLEETGYLLQRVLSPLKPLVLTAAMRPADALQADGPQNLLDAVTVALQPQVQGVLAVLNGVVWAAAEVRKVHPYRLDAFSAGDAGPLAFIEEGQLRPLRPWPQGLPLGAAVLDPEIWPEVQLVSSHAGADGRIVDLLCEAGVQGLVVGCTGNGTVHHELFAALLRAQSRGVAVLRALRSGSGCILPGSAHDALPHAASLTPAQARVELLLRLLAARRR